MITHLQIKAARALLEWKQEDLARVSKVSLATVANIEQGKGKTRGSTLSAIQNAFEEVGIEFTPDPGVRLRRERFEMKMLEGPDAAILTWLDIEQTLGPLGGGEALLSGVDEAWPLKHFPVEFRAMIKRRESLNIKTRLLICEGDNLIAVALESYRAIPKALFQQTPYYVYGDKIALINPYPPRFTMVMKNKYIAQTFRSQFEFNWDHGKKLDPKKVVMAKI